MILAITVFSCEEYVVVDDLPYIQTLVIQGIVQHNKKVDSIKITRTLPPLQEYSEDEAIIKDAEVRFIASGRIYRLIYDSQTKAYKLEGLFGVRGLKYDLTVIWKNDTLRATTFIPDTVIVDSVYQIIQKSNEDGSAFNQKIYARFKPQHKTVYIGGFIDKSLPPDRQYRSTPYTILRNTDTAKDGKIHFPVFEWFTNDLKDTNQIKERYQFYIEAYDEQFYDYFMTRYEGNPNDDIFGTKGRNIKGNATGSGFGIFYGKNETIFQLK